MAINLIEMLSSQMGGTVLSQASKMLGESEASTQSAIGAALPAILGSVIQKGANQNGAQSILDMITGGGYDGGMLNSIGSLFAGGDASHQMSKQGQGILSSLLGNNSNTVVNMIAQISGIGQQSSSSLMSMLAPMVMSGIGKQVMGKGVAGLMDFLGGQAGFVKAAAPAELSNVMGFANLSGMANTATAAANQAVDSGSSMMQRLLPLGLLALLAVGVFWFFQGGSAAEAASTVTNAASEVADVATDAASTAAEAVTDAAATTADMATDAAGAVVDATVAAANKALAGVTFAAGSVGEKFTHFLSSGEAGMGAAFAFNKLTFNTGSAEITAETLSEVDNLAKALVAYPNVHIEIGGHTDNTGDTAGNEQLSTARAEAVKARLVAQGVGADRVVTKGYGEAQPLAANDTEEGRQANRRIEVKITQR